MLTALEHLVTPLCKGPYLNISDFINVFCRSRIRTNEFGTLLNFPTFSTYTYI